MRRLACLVTLVALASPLSAQPKGGPLSPEDALNALKVADGFQVELFAAEPMLINPTTIDVDHMDAGGFGPPWNEPSRERDIEASHATGGRPTARKHSPNKAILCVLT